MKVNAPSIFRKPIKKNVFEKKYVKRIENPSDNKFFVGSFKLQGDVYILREGLGDDENRRLKNILKVIKKNSKSSVKVMPLALAGIFVGALVVFFVVFANPLLGYATEKGLEAAFQAKADVNSFRLSLIDFEISFKKLTVADKDHPMKNLFELGKTRIKLTPQAILRGKVNIEEIRADGIGFGTDRKTSGALPGYAAAKAKAEAEKAKQPKEEAPPLVDLKNFDAMALLEKEYDKLTSPKLYDEAIALYDETLEKWQKQVDDAKAQVDAVKAAAQPVLNLNANSVTDLQSIPQTVKDIDAMIATVKAASDTANTLVNSLDADIKTAQAMEQKARNAVNADIAFLKSYVDLGSGAAFAVLEPVIKDILSDTAKQYIDYGLQALDIMDQLKAQSSEKPKNEKPKKQPKVVFKGRNVYFPSPNYPTFYLGTLASDITVGSWKGEFDLQNVSSNPEFKNDKPITLTIAATEIEGDLNRKVEFDGMADFRTNEAKKQLFTANVTGGGFPVALEGDGLSSVGINGFKGMAGFKVGVTGDPNFNTTIKSDVNILQAQLVNPSGTLAEAIDSAVRQVGHVDLGVTYTALVDQSDKFVLTTNLMDLIGKAMQAAAAAYAKKAMDEIEKAVKARLNQYIDGKFASSEDLDNLLKAAQGDKAAIDQLSNGLNNKKNEFEQKVKGAAQQAAQQAANEVKQQGQQAAQDVLQGKTPTAPTAPKLPSSPSIPGLPKR